MAQPLRAWAKAALTGTPGLRAMDPYCTLVLHFDLLQAAIHSRRFRDMADDTAKRGPADRSRINIHEPHEVRYWTQALGVSEQQLKAAVEKVGVMAEAVKSHLGK